MAQLDAVAVVAGAVCLQGLWGLAGQPHAPALALALALLAAGACVATYGPLFRTTPARTRSQSHAER